jgi:putative peptidoglycan lipid II flippase
MASMISNVLRVGGFTTLSRLLGFLRDQLVAYTLGTSLVAEAFFIAQRFPNLFRTMFAEGAFNTAFVPLFAKRIEASGKDNAMAFARDVYGVLLVWMLLFTGLCMLLMPWLIYVIAWGFSGTPEKLSLTTTLTVICFPYLLFMSLTALQGGVLNSLNRFTAAAFAPVLLNLVMIASNVVAWYWGTGQSDTTGYIFAWGVTLSGLAQFALLIASCKYAGVSLWPSRPKLTDDVKLVAKRSLPGIFSGGIMQINLLIASQIATTLPQGVANLYYAERLYQLPLGIIGVSVGVVLLPLLSRRLRAGDTSGAIDAANRGLEFSLFLTLPATAALMTIPAAILQTVFEHGAFSAKDTAAVAPAVIAFAAALPAFAFTKVLQPIFYAREDTKTPMRFSIISVVTNVVAALILSRTHAHVGIALATTLAAWTNAFLLYWKLQQLGHFNLDARSKKKIPLMILATLIMVGVLWGSWYLLQNNFLPTASFASTAFSLLALIVAGAVSYFLAAFATKAFTLSDLKSSVTRNKT